MPLDHYFTPGWIN